MTQKSDLAGFVTPHQYFINSSCRDASHRSNPSREIRTFLPTLQNLKHPFSAYREIACLDMNALEAASAREMYSSCLSSEQFSPKEFSPEPVACADCRFSMSESKADRNVFSRFPHEIFSSEPSSSETTIWFPFPEDLSPEDLSPADLSPEDLSSRNLSSESVRSL